MRFAGCMVFAWLMLVLPVQAQELRTEPTNERRIAIETAVTLSGTAVAIGAGLGAGAGMMHRCESQPFYVVGLGCAWRGATVTMGVTFGLLPIALTLGSYLPHHALGGKGRWYWSLLGAAAGIGGGLGIVSIPANAKDDGAPMIAGVVLGSLFAASMPLLALELSHGRQRRIEREQRRQLMPTASMLPQGGGWIGVAGTL